MAKNKVKFDVTAQNKTQGAFTQINRDLNKTSSGMKKIAAAFASAFAIQKLVAFGNESLQMADAIGKTADSIGVGVEFLQRYQFVAQQAGLSTEEFNKSMQVFTKMTGEAATGTGEAKMAFEALGVSLKKSDGQFKTTEELFIDFFKATDDIAEANKKAAYFADVFGRAGVKNTVMAKEGTPAMIALSKAATGVFSEETIRNAERFNDEMNRLNRKILTPMRAKMIEILGAYMDVAEGLGLIEPDPVVETMEEINQAFLNSQQLVLAYMHTLKHNTQLTTEQQDEIKKKLLEEIKIRDEAHKKIIKYNAENADSTVESTNVIKAAIDGYLTALGSVEERLGKAATGSMKKFEDTIVDGLKNGKLEFKAFADYVIEQLLRIAIQEAILAPLKDAFGSFFDFGSNKKVEPKAMGGAVTAGSPYLVGEKGPELFMPNSSGQIITNENLQQQSMQSAPTVNFNISTVDAAGFDQLLASRKGLITSIINNAMNNQGKMGVV
jgi:hypothetical protein